MLEWFNLDCFCFDAEVHCGVDDGNDQILLMGAGMTQIRQCFVSTLNNDAVAKSHTVRTWGWEDTPPQGIWPRQYKTQCCSAADQQIYSVQSWHSSDNYIKQIQEEIYYDLNLIKICPGIRAEIYEAVHRCITRTGINGLIIFYLLICVFFSSLTVYKKKAVEIISVSIIGHIPSFSVFL